MAERFLIFESERAGLRALFSELQRTTSADTRIESVASEAELRSTLRSEAPFDLMVASFSGDNSTLTGPKLTRLVRRTHPTVPIVLTSIIDDPRAASEAIKAGATEFLVCDDDLAERVEAMLQKVRAWSALEGERQSLDAENRALRESASSRFRLVGSSIEFEKLDEQIRRVAAIPRPVLVLGERGTGKELVARKLHERSDRSSQPFIAVNCAALTETLIDSELFGHERGAFSGAQGLRIGKFEEATEGTLFLDEIGHMSLAAQQKILRVVEYGSLRRVGGSSDVLVDVRIVAATNADLEAMMERREFLRDLYDRLAFEVIEVPPLRSHPTDIRLLSQHFLDQFMAEVPTFRGKHLGERAIRMLESYSFPGNVRELKNIIERAVYRDTTNEINPEDIGLISSGVSDIPGETFHDRVGAFERKLIVDALEASGGNQSRAAKILGMTYHQFRHFYKKHRVREENA
jgi:psp operon transcriptional activator